MKNVLRRMLVVVVLLVSSDAARAGLSASWSGSEVITETSGVGFSFTLSSAQ
jgi:hypothetical protein